VACEGSSIPNQATVYSSAMLTVLGSGLLHGATASPLAARYGKRVAQSADGAEFEEVTKHPLRSSLPPGSI